MSKHYVNELEEVTAGAGVTCNSVFKANTISERTAGAGVTVGGVLLKSAVITVTAILFATAQFIETAGVIKARNLANTADMPITASALTLSGALSGATSGAFSGAVSMAGLTATTGAFSGNAVVGAASVTNPIGWARMAQVVGGDNAVFSVLATNTTARQWDFGTHNRLGDGVHDFIVYDATLGDYALIIRGGTKAVTIPGAVTLSSTLAVTGAFGCNGNAAQTKYASGGTLAGVVQALINNGILST